MEATVR